MRTLFRLFFLLALSTTSVGIWAQSNPEAQELKASQHFYRLDFRFQELDASGHVTNTRTYTAISCTNDKSRTHSIRTGDKIPVLSGAPDTSVFQYMDVGVNIDFETPSEMGNSLVILISAQLSSLASMEESPAEVPATRQRVGIPVIRQNSWKALVKVVLRKPTVIFSSDNISNGGKTQLELTATPIE